MMGRGRCIRTAGNESHQPSGRRRFRELVLPPPLPPLRGRFFPSPSPLPWGLGGEGPGVVRASQIAPNDSKMAQDSPIWPSRWHKIANDGSRWPPTCPKRPQDGPKTVPSGHGAFQGYCREVKIIEKLIGVSMSAAFSPCRFRWDSEASRWLQESPKRVSKKAEKKQTRNHKR